MNKEYLIALKKKIADLDDKEKKLRDLYLKQIANGEVLGPQVGYPSIDKPWLKYFNEEDISLDIPNITAYDYLLLNNYENLDSIAIKYLNTKIKYKEMFASIKRVAKSLKMLNVQKGEIITIATISTPELIYLLYAINRVGAVANVIDPRLAESDIRKELNKVNSKIYITLDSFAENGEKATKGTNVENVISLSPVESCGIIVKNMYKLKNKNNISKCMNWDEFIAQGLKYEGVIDIPYEKDTPLALVRTGGTTGDPKGVVLTNEDFVSMAHMHKHSEIDFEKGDSFLNILPPFIAYCLCNGINNPLTLGMELTIVPKWEVPEFPDLMEKYKPNHVLAGPILWEYVIKSNITDLSYLKTPVSGGDSLNKELEERINDFFKDKGCTHKVAQGYGMTEVSSAATFSYPRSNMLGSVGIPFIKNKVSAFNPNSLDELHTGEEGEIWISTPTLMKEYYQNQDATEKIIYKNDCGEKWIKTGDLGRIDEDGRVFLLGRIKRMIVRNGNKIFPSTAEEVILKNKNIENCAMVAMDDEIERKVPVLFVIKKEGIEETEITSWINKIIKEELPDFYIPKKIIFIEELPLTSINKVDYKKLEEQLKKDKSYTLVKKAL